MSEQIKELLKKDIVKIASLSLGMDYTDKENIERLYEDLFTTHPFYTNFGNRYLSRLQAILKEDPFEHQCVLCGKDSGENPVICKQCLEEIPVKEETAQEETIEEENLVQEETVEEKPFQENAAEEVIQEESDEEEAIQEEILEEEDTQAEEVAQEETVEEEQLQEKDTEEETTQEEISEGEYAQAEEVAQEETVEEEQLQEKDIQEETIQEEIIDRKKIKDEVQPKTEGTVENDKKDIEEIVENGSVSEKAIDSKIDSRRLYLLYSVIVILLIVIFKQSISGGVGDDKKNEFSAAQAKEVVQEFYDKTKYKISLQEVSECPKAVFEASQGKQVPQEAWLSSELVGVYAFSITDNKANIMGQVWVSFRGEAIQLGMTENEKFIVLKEVEN